MTTLLTLAESRDRLRLGKGRLNQLVQSGELPSISIGRRRLVSESDLAEFVEAHRVGGSWEVGGKGGAGGVIETPLAPGRRAIGNRHVPH